MVAEYNSKHTTKAGYQGRDSSGSIPGAIYRFPY